MERANRRSSAEQSASRKPAQDAAAACRLPAMRSEQQLTAAGLARRHDIYRKASGAEARKDADIPQGGGAPLAEPVRRKMEPALGADLSHVRVHTGGDSAQAATQLGARAFAVGNDVHFGAGQYTPGTREGDRLMAHELTHTLQSAKGGVQRKADGVSQPGDGAEKEADHVADHVADKLHGDGGGPAPQIRSAAPAIGRKGDDDEAAGKTAAKKPAPDPAELALRALVEPFGVNLDGALGRVTLLLLKSWRGVPASAEEKAQATAAVTALDEAAFALLMTVLQATGLMQTFLAAVGDKNAGTTVAHMATEIKVPAVTFGNVAQAQVLDHFGWANKVLEKQHMKVTPAQIVDGDRELRREGGAKKKLGVDGGKIDGAQLDTNALGEYSEQVARIIARFQQPGMINSYWFAEILTPPEREDKLAGRAVREAEDARFHGREAVFLDINGGEAVLAHELGHVLGGKSEAGQHAKGGDGQEASGDPENVMFHKGEDGKQQDKVTPEQAQVWKTSIYGQISKVQPKPDDKGGEKKGG